MQADTPTHPTADPAFPETAEALAEVIDIPLQDWPGNCHAVARATLDLAPVRGMRIARGHWTGRVSRKSVYKNTGMVQHSWLVLEDGRILDPTRWAIETPEDPALYVGWCDAYDEGGRMSRARTRHFQAHGPQESALQDAGAPDLTERLRTLDRAALMALLRGEVAEQKLAQESRETLVAIANRAIPELIHRDPTHLDDPWRVYSIIERIGLKALVPIDSWARVMTPETITCPDGCNRYFAPPRGRSGFQMSRMEKLLELYLAFLLPENNRALEAHLEEMGHGLDTWFECLNRFEFAVNTETAPDGIGNRRRDLLALVAGDLLGEGPGEVLRVERYAASMAMSRSELDSALRELPSLHGPRIGWM